MKKALATLDEDVQRDWMRAQLTQDVATMRGLGVAKWRDIELGTIPGEPVTPPTKEDLAERAYERETRRRDIMFAGSSVKPLIDRARAK